MAVPKEIQEICRRSKISEYLISRGIELSKTNKGMKCKCPLPDHPDDNTPSFYITTLPDGTELFKCFGRCGAGGNIITLIKKMENKQTGVVPRLAKNLGMNSFSFNENEYVPEPTNDEIICSFCNEDNQVMDISEKIKELIDIHGASKDIINKASNVYKMMDEMILKGDDKAIEKTNLVLQKIIKKYES